MLEGFIIKRFNRKSALIIDQANAIIEEYLAAGMTLTLRQVFYQFVSRGYLPNRQKEYKRLGAIISDARLAGLVDWSAIEDTTRGLSGNVHFSSPLDAVQRVRRSYGIDMWEGQDYRLEVWIEKQALAGVIDRVCAEFDVPYLSCRGYVSQSEQWRAYHRFNEHEQNGQKTVIIHLGDHDPSGIDMTRDNDERLVDTFKCEVDLQRIALNMDQIRKYNPPPNPAKSTDSRFKHYTKIHGPSSWELDALDPKVIQKLIRSKIESYIDPGPWNRRLKLLAEHEKQFDKIVKDLENPKPKRKKRKSKRKSKK